jgi:hypothetical protein
MFILKTWNIKYVYLKKLGKLLPEKNSDFGRKF